MEKKDGWVRRVVAELAARGVRIRAICAGVPGDRSADMRGRFEVDVVARRPKWLVLNCGVNDVWHGAAGCTLDQFRDNVTAMLERALAANISVLCSTATLVGEDLTSSANRTLARYNDVVRVLAGERGLRLADCSKAFHDSVEAHGAIAGAWLTEDGVHFNARGETVMADAILAGWGVSIPPRGVTRRRA